MGVSHEDSEGGAPADGGGDDFSIIETTPTSVHTQVHRYHRYRLHPQYSTLYVYYRYLHISEPSVTGL